MSSLNSLLNLTILFLIAFAFPFQASGQASEQGVPQSSLTVVERPDEELLILAMHLERYILSEGITGYIHRGGVLLSLEEVVLALEFAIAVDPPAGQASGWFINEKRLFSLDVSRREVVVDGKKETFDPALVELHSDGIYVDASLFDKWLGVALEVNLPRQVINVKSRQPLPLEQRLAREQAQARLGRGTTARPIYPRADAPYSLLDWPFIDASMNLSYRNQRSGGRESRYSGSISGDFLYMSSVLFLAGKDGDTLTDVRLTMGRSDPDGNLFGPLHVQSFRLGDIYSPQIPLISNSNAGRGAEISNFPLNRPSEFDRTTLQGELPLNWAVELYRNEVLLDNQQSRDDGRYEFIDVPLLYGNNILRLIFYGPQGQKREEVRSIFVGANLVRPGTENFRISAVQQDKSLFLVKNTALNNELVGLGRYIAEYERGISNRFSIAANGVSLPFEDGRRYYAGLGLRAAMLGTYSRVDISRQHGGGTAVQLATQFGLLGNDISAEHGQFFDFESERIRKESDPIRSQSRVRLGGAIPFKPLKQIPYSLEGLLERRESGRERADLSNRLSFYWHGVSVSNTLKGSLLRGGGSVSTKRVDGQLLVSGQLKKLSLRSQVSYDPPPHHQFRSASFTGDYRINQNFSTRFSANRDLIAGRWTDFSMGLNRTFEQFIVGLEGRYVNNDNYAISMAISFSMGRQPRSNSFMLRSRRMGYSGAVSVRVFLDENQNGRFDAADQPLEGVRLRSSGSVSKETDKNGVTFIPDLASYRPADITIDLGSLEDPFWIPVSEGVAVMPRPGKSALLEFPIIATGEIDGTAYLKRGNTVNGASNVELQLLNTFRVVVQQVKTSFDGFYLFTNVSPGRYFVRVSPDQAKRLNLEQPPDSQVVIGGNGDVVSGVDFTIERKKESEK